MPFSPQQIEELEKKYFLELKEILTKRKEELIDRFNSRLAIRRDTQGISYKENEVEAGAERVLAALICREKLDWQTNSSPISSNLLFELPNAIMNVDAKTYKNRSREDDKVNLARNQTSYGDNIHITSRRTGTRYTWKAALKPIYCHEEKGELPTLSYVVKFIYDDNDQSLLEVELINIPNGKLIQTYGKQLFMRGKSTISPGMPVRDVRFKISKFANPKLTENWQRRALIYRR